MESLPIALVLNCHICGKRDMLSLFPLLAEHQDGPVLVGFCNRCNETTGWDMHEVAMAYWREIQPPFDPTMN